MSEEQSLPRRATGRSRTDLLKKIGSGSVVVALLVVGFWGSHFLEPNQPITKEESEAPATDPETARKIILSQAKADSSGIHTATASWVDWQRTKTVAAKVDYNSSRHVLIEAPVECVVERWLV